MSRNLTHTAHPATPGTLPRIGYVPDLLRPIRRAAARSRAGRRLDMFGACAMLSTDRDLRRGLGRDLGLGLDRDTAGLAYLDTLLRTLEQGLGRAPVIYCETCPQVSFDERWLLALLDAHRRDDRDSCAFLLCSRVRHAARRHVGFLIAGIARAANPIADDPRKTA